MYSQFMMPGQKNIKLRQHIYTVLCNLYWNTE